MVRTTMALVQGTFNIRRFWLNADTPKSVLDQLNIRYGVLVRVPKNLHLPYVDANFYGEGDKNCTMMELKYGEWIIDREEITYTVEGDDGL